MTTALSVMVLLAQLQLATVRGVVVAADDSSVLPGATVQLTDPLGGLIDSRISDATGRFVFPTVAPGRYLLRVTITGFQTVTHAITVAAALPLEVTLRLPLGVVQIVDYVGQGDSPATPASIAAESIAQIPVRNMSRGVQDAVATLPGWATEDNGLLHVRGIDDGFLYVVDGVPVYERLDPLNGMGPDMANVESINVITGYIPAEFGHKAGGVIDVRSKSLGKDWLGTVQVERSSDDATAASALAGWRFAPSIAMTLAAHAQDSDRFLDPIHPDNFHNHGGGAGAESQLTWSPSDASLLNIAAAFGRLDYDVPNTEAQAAASQDQRQRIRRDHVTMSWQHAFRSSTFSQLAGYARRSQVSLAGTAADTPLFAEADRRLSRAGMLAGLTRGIGSNTIKTGAEIQQLRLDESFMFAVTDDEQAEAAGLSEAARNYDVSHPFVFTGNARPMLWSVFVQDEWQPDGPVTVSGGVRFDVSHLGARHQQLSPRVGATYRADRTVLRGSISRFFQPPQPEYFLLSSSEEARTLSPFAEGGSGGAELEPERQWMFEAGINHRFASRLTVDAAFWRRTITDVADPNVFAGTTIIFPNAVARGRAMGADLRVELPRRTSWSAYVNLSVGRVRQNGPMTGGLFLEDDIADIASGEEFAPDHDQRVAAGGAVTWMHPTSRASVSASVRYESGTPIQRDEDEADELGERPGAELVDFEQGRVKGRTIASLVADVPVWKNGRRSASIRASAINLFDAEYAYNFGNPFSGTHFGAPRTVSVALQLEF